TLAGVRLPIGIAPLRPDDQVIDAIAVDIARGCHRNPTLVDRVDAGEHEAVRAVEGREFHRRGRAHTRATEHAVRLTSQDQPEGAGRASPDEEVIKAIAVDISRG